VNARTSAQCERIGLRAPPAIEHDPPWQTRHKRGQVPAVKVRKILDRLARRPILQRGLVLRCEQCN
jgi:hypothetical protein